jgi:hypothetical protein
MRRLIALGVSIVATVAFAGQASAHPSGAFPVKSRFMGHTALEVHRAYLSWVFGSATNPIRNGGCGEIVGGIYFAPVAVAPGTTAECDVPAGVAIAVSPAGTASEIPTWGANDEEIVADAELTFGEVLFSGLSVDGRAIDPWPWTISAGAYDVVIETGSHFDLVCEGLIDPWCKVDFVGGETVRMATVAQVVLLKPMTPGTHVVEFADRFSFTPVLDMTLTLHVG